MMSRRVSSSTPYPFSRPRLGHGTGSGTRVPRGSSTVMIADVNQPLRDHHFHLQARQQCNFQQSDYFDAPFLYASNMSCNIRVASAQSTTPAFSLGRSNALPVRVAHARSRSSPRKPPCMRSSVGSGNSTSSEHDIERLNRSYCDDFECTSSPSIENSVRSFARDLEVGRNSFRLFDRDVRYDDGFRQCSGAQNAARQAWVMESVESPQVTILKMQMISQDTAQIDWELVGKLNNKALDARFSSEITMNLLTGRILAVKERWDISKSAPAVALSASASRVAYAAKMASQDAQAKMGKIGEAIDNTLSSFDDSTGFTQDPRDPTKYYQQDNQSQQDYLNFALVVSIMYLVYKGFEMTLMK